MNKKSNSRVRVERFFSEIDVEPLLRTFDMLDETLVWIKDRESRIMFANDAFVYQYGADSLERLLNKSDYDFSPPSIARKFIDDDQKVLQGIEIHDRLELNIQRSGEITWFETNKFPLRSKRGTIIGTYGISHRREKSSIPLVAVQQLEVSIDYIRSNYRGDIQIGDLAQISCISVSALERRFKKYLHKTPRQFINEIRLEQARRMLREGNQSIASIASSVGYADPGYFTRLFHRYFDCSPTDYRHKRK